MKRLIAGSGGLPRTAAQALLVLCVAAGAGACSPDDGRSARTADAPPSGWMAPPRFDSVAFSPEAVVVSGQAEPNRRVVLSDRTGLAAAASADPQGAFSIRLAARPGLSLWRIDMAVAAEEARTGEWLAVFPEDRQAVVLRSGASARPVGAAGLLATADYDGGGLLVAGRAAPGQQVEVSVDGGPSRTVLTDDQGWYEARFPAVPPGPHRLRAQTDTRLQESPLVLAVPSGGTDFAREASGLRINWSPSGGGAQTTWIVRGAAASQTPAAS